MQKIKHHVRFIVAAIALGIAFALSITFSDRGFEFDLSQADVVASEKDGYNLSRLEVLSRVLLQIKDNYVDPDRIKPDRMIVYALDEIQNSIAEVVITFDKDKDKTPTKVTVQVENQSKSFKISGIESLWEMKLRLAEIFTFVQKNLKDNPDIEFNEIEYAAILSLIHI